LLENCQTPADAAKLKILDPACGSGSFLVGAYAVLIDWHIKYYDTKKKLNSADRADAYYDSDGRVRLTARLKRQILINNLFGVDIDQQAVEVTRFSLSLKALEDTRREELYEERSLFKETVLPDLNNNIKCGNSLIGPDYFSGKMFPDSEELRRVNPFDWQREFPAIFQKWEKDEAVNHSYNKGFKPLVGGPFVDRAIDSDLWFVTFVTHNSRVSERMVTFGIQSGEPLIFSSEDQDFIKEIIFEECKKEDIVVLAMNVLPDHVHMVIAATDETNLTEKIRKIKGYSSHAFQRSREWPKGTEHVWAQKFNSRLIKNDEELAAVINYIQYNHLKHAERWGDEEIVNKGHIAEGNKGLKPLVEYNVGFDAVIGNPPYVRQETLGDDFKSYVKEKYDSYAGTADLYVYFIEQTLKLLRKNGNFGFICSNKWMRSNYGHHLRDLIIKESKIEQIVDFGELPVFQGAATFPAILLLKKEKTKEQNFIYAPIKRLDFVSLSDEINKIGEKLNENSIKGENWTLASRSKVAILEKMLQIGIPFGEYVNGKIYYGIKTGLDEAFVIDRETRDRLIAEDKNSAEIIKPFVNGDDVRKYSINFREKYLIFTRHGIDIEKYPAIEKHLSNFKDRLMPKPANWIKDEWKGRKPGSYNWYEIQDTIDYYEEFEKPKIVYPEIAKESRFQLDFSNYYYPTTVFICPKNDVYLLGLLNSSLIWFYLKQNCSVLGDSEKGGRLRLKRQYLTNIPIRKIDFSNNMDKTLHDRMVKLVDSMLGLHKHKTAAKTQTEQEMIQRQIDAIDREIDRIVYELYGLTEKEIKIVENIDS
jgi:REP element-mobilizing transposase RayT